MPSVVKQSPFSATLFASPPLVATEEQKILIRDVLKLCSSDSFFANKAYEAIRLILLGNTINPVPVLVSLNPSTARLGDPPFLLHVHGTGFLAASKITFNGIEVTTTFVNASELTTMVDISGFSQPISGSVGVTTNNVASDPLSFSITAADPVTRSLGNVENEEPGILERLRDRREERRAHPDQELPEVHKGQEKK